MHAPRHEDELPEHVPPMVVPDTPKEARLLQLCLEAGYLPTYDRGDKKSADSVDETEAYLRAKAA